MAERTSWGGRQKVEIVSRAEKAKASRRADEPVRSTVSLHCVFVLSDLLDVSPSHNIYSTPDQPVGPVRGLRGKISNPDFTTKFTMRFLTTFTTLVYSFKKKLILLLQKGWMLHLFGNPREVDDTSAEQVK